MQLAPSNPWKSTFCGCCDEFPQICFACCDPCCAAYMVYMTFSLIPNGAPIPRCYFYLMCPGIAGTINRYDLRKYYGIQGSACTDCLIHCCFHACLAPCALVQEHLHVKKSIRQFFSIQSQTQVQMLTIQNNHNQNNYDLAQASAVSKVSKGNSQKEKSNY